MKWRSGKQEIPATVLFLHNLYGVNAALLTLTLTVLQCSPIIKKIATVALDDINKTLNIFKSEFFIFIALIQIGLSLINSPGTYMH